MLLFNPTAGEIVDRRTILRLKLRHTDSKSVFKEMGECDEAIDKLYGLIPIGQGKVKEFNRLWEELSKRNARQWELEDAVRAAIKALPEIPTYEQLKNVVDIQRENAFGNEDRARLKREIDALFGEEGEFKKYA